MPIPFIAEQWIKWKDIERCPYPIFRNHPDFMCWTKIDDERLLCIALDRYAAFIVSPKVEQDKEILRRAKRLPSMWRTDGY